MEAPIKNFILNCIFEKTVFSFDSAIKKMLNSAIL